ncbi:MAG: hypothetical protein ACK4UN_15185, partial [Limisphaerales bacterium]
ISFLLLADTMSLVQKGSSADFWQNASGIDLREQEHESIAAPFGGFYQPRDGWYIYYSQGFHGKSLYRVPREQAVADFPEVVRKIRALDMDQELPPTVRWASAVLKRDPSNLELSPEQFLALAADERLKALRDRNYSLYESALSDEQAFTDRWVRFRYYWVTILSEICFFAGFTLFALWPWLRQKGRLSWALHLGFLPLLLMLPYYFGYASLTFTSAGPSSGVLYPCVIFWFRDFQIWTDADLWMLQYFPKFLELDPEALEPVSSFSGDNTMGPVSALLMGLMILICISPGRRYSKYGHTKANVRT